MIRISKTQAVEKQLRREGKILDLDRPEHIAAMVRMNRELAKLRREHRAKIQRSGSRAGRIRCC